MPSPTRQRSEKGLGRSSRLDSPVQGPARGSRRWPDFEGRRRSRLVKRGWPRGRHCSTHTEEPAGTARTPGWWAPSWRSPRRARQLEHFPELSVYYNQLVPGFCSHSCLADASGSPGSGGQGSVCSWSHGIVIIRVTQEGAQNPVWHPDFGACYKGTPIVASEAYVHVSHRTVTKEEVFLPKSLVFPGGL